VVFVEKLQMEVRESGPKALQQLISGGEPPRLEGCPVRTRIGEDAIGGK